MIKFYVLGYDAGMLPTLLSARAFTTGAEAQRFADTCENLLEAFVVRTATPEELKPEPPKPEPNTNPKTKIPYGYISANALDPEIAERLLFGGQARDLSFEEFCEEQTREVEIEASERGLHHGTQDWGDWCERERERERRLEAYEPPDELSIEGRYEGVTYRTSYLGGALNFWILDSPCTTDKARRASPCVPGAAILDVLDGSEFGYDVPAYWRADA